MGILKNDEVVYVDKKDDPSNYIRFGSHVGQRRPPYFGMLGQILMVYLPELELEELMKRRPLEGLTKKSITDQERFRERLAVIRSQGYVVDEGEAIDGISGVAAPIRDFSGRVIAAVGVGFLSLSEDSRGLKKIIRETLKSASAISAAMGYSKAEDRMSPAAAL